MLAVSLLCLDLMAWSPADLYKPRNRAQHDILEQRLADVGVHAGIQAFLHVLGVGVGAHGDDGHSPGTGLPAGADGPGRGVAVHDRHHQVHQNRIAARRVGGKGAHGALAVKRLDDLGPGAFQHELGDLHVQLVILDNQQALAVQVGGGFLLRPGGGRVVVYGKRQRDGKAITISAIMLIPFLSCTTCLPYADIHWMTVFILALKK